MLHFSFSYVGVTIGPTYKYQSEPYDGAKEARKVCNKQKSNISPLFLMISNLTVVTINYSCILILLVIGKNVYSVKFNRGSQLSYNFLAKFFSAIQTDHSH